MRWTVETLDAGVDTELDAPPVSLRARMLRLMEMVEAVGLENMREPHVRHVEGKLWELRAKAAKGIARGLICDGRGPARRHTPRLRQEVAKDAPAGARHRP